MVGIRVKFSCPNCNYSSDLQLGVTPYVHIKGKGKNFAVRPCPECLHTIAFKTIKKPKLFNKNNSSSVLSFDLALIPKEYIKSAGVICR